MNTTRRTLLKHLVYVPPAVILTLPATPTFAGTGSTSRARPSSGKRMLPVPPAPVGPPRRNERARSIKKEGKG